MAKSSIAPGIFLCLATVCVPATVAAQSETTVTARVDTATINLTNSDGMATLERRLITASRRACMADQPGARRITESVQTCMNGMIADGMAQGRRIALNRATGRAVAVR